MACKSYKEQSYDVAGIHAVKLQKTLVFLFVTSLFLETISWILAFGMNRFEASFLTAVLPQFLFSIGLFIILSLIKLIGYCGAKNRSACGVTFYGVCELTRLILSLVLIAICIFMAVSHGHQEHHSEEPQHEKHSSHSSHHAAGKSAGPEQLVPGGDAAAEATKNHDKHHEARDVAEHHDDGKKDHKHDDNHDNKHDNKHGDKHDNKHEDKHEDKHDIDHDATETLRFCNHTNHTSLKNWVLHFFSHHHMANHTCNRTQTFEDDKQKVVQNGDDLKITFTKDSKKSKKYLEKKEKEAKEKVHDNKSEEEIAINTSAMVLLQAYSILACVLQVVTFIMWIYSIALAFRLRRLLKAANANASTDVEQSSAYAAVPANDDSDDENAPPPMYVFAAQTVSPSAPPSEMVAMYSVVAPTSFAQPTMPVAKK
eukprot:TRINITY_DN8941_c0_g1_i1.p1 TRINITY_DN8941_c0_g1~~TRINITY_DN8941_c0_g1_i1.p1  ORF type:complete len:451 (+),score=175.76 TRINITY_DN8941_c0_g1_i1:78-1355(+)